MKKKGISSLIAMLLCTLASTAVFAFSAEVEPSSIGGNLETSVLNILGVVQWIGFIVAIGMAIYIGIKYLTAGAGTKAEVKATMIPWLVGALCIALAPTIATTVFQMFAGSD